MATVDVDDEYIAPIGQCRVEEPYAGIRLLFTEAGEAVLDCLHIPSHSIKLPVGWESH